MGLIVVVILIVAIIVLLLSVGVSLHLSPPSLYSRRCSLMRKLWYDHVLWTHKYILAAVYDLPHKDNVAARLMLNQRHLADAILPGSASSGLRSLLEEHITIATKIVSAAMTGNTGEVQTYTAQWEANADAIAKYLSDHGVGNFNANRDMMRHHLNITLQEATAIISKNSADEIKYLDEAINQSQGMADALC